jgi:hypothetical protein
MTVRQRVIAIQLVLAATVVAGAIAVFFAAANLQRPYGVIVGIAAALALLFGFRAVFSRRRVILWMEERVPSLRYALVALSEHPDSRYRGILEARVRDSSMQRPLAVAFVRLALLPLIVVLALQFIAKPLIARTVAGASRPEAGTPRPVAAGDQIFVAIVTPPNYSRLPADTIENPTSVSALVGSSVQFVGAWSADVTMPRQPTALRLSGRTERIVVLEPRADSAPAVVLELPVRDTVLPTAAGVLTLSASARDDFGVATGWFEMIVSSGGEGETFNARSAVFGRVAAAQALQLQLNAVLRLDTLGLKPGDVVHLRAVARDANPARDAEPGSSETRTLRVFRRGEGDSVAVEAAPPPEVGRSELSQRMLINMTEKLVADMRRLSRNDVTREASNIAREQARLRRRVGAIIFTRLTGDEPEPDDTAGIDIDTLPPGEALLKAASAATNIPEHMHSEEEQGGDGTVIGINAPLLEAFNAMWEAERRLGVVEPRQALPHMRAALAAIQRARAAERLYLRGQPPKIVIDLARVRLSGKRDAIDPTLRTPRASAIAALAARRERFYAALDRLEAEPGAAIDSLTILRVDALTPAPVFAAALGTAIDDLRAGRDATASLLSARRALSGAPTSGAQTRWSGL